MYLGDVNFARTNQRPRRVKVRFMIFENGGLPTHSTVDFVLGSAFAEEFGTWLRDAAHSDLFSRCFFQEDAEPGGFMTPHGVQYLPGVLRSSGNDDASPHLRKSRCPRMTHPTTHVCQ